MPDSALLPTRPHYVLLSGRLCLCPVSFASNLLEIGKPQILTVEI